MTDHHIYYDSNSISVDDKCITVKLEMTNNPSNCQFILFKVVVTKSTQNGCTN